MKVKKVVKAPLEEAREFVREAKRQVTAKAPAPEELLGIGPTLGKKKLQKIQERDEEELRRIREEKAKMLAEWRQRYGGIQKEILKLTREREREIEEKERVEEAEKKEQQEKKPKMLSGEEAIAATGASQKRPTGLWGIGGKFKKMFKWFTAERKGRAPR